MALTVTLNGKEYRSTRFQRFDTTAYKIKGAELHGKGLVLD